jgi:hypothetical protein
VDASQYELLEYAGKGAHAVVSCKKNLHQPSHNEILVAFSGCFIYELVAGSQPS